MNLNLKQVIIATLALTLGVTVVGSVIKSTKVQTAAPKEITAPVLVEEPPSTLTIPTKKKHISKLVLEPETTLFLFQEVDDGISNSLANTITSLDNGETDPLYLLIDSPGGSVFAGAKIIQAIEASKRPVHTVCVGLCASMGAMIHSYGNKRLSTDRSVLMYHPAAGRFGGFFPQIKSLYGTVERYIHKMELNVAKRSKMSPEQYEQRILRDFWIDGEDALNVNLADQLVVVDVSQLTSPAAETYLKRRPIGRSIRMIETLNLFDEGFMPIMKESK